jgi:predicted ATP-grasp superfamily ATP-dependent carboligase
MRVLVLGGRTYYSLPVIRALGRAGHRVTVGDSARRSIGFFSRYTSGSLVHPPVTEEGSFVGELASYLTRHPHDAILPLFEEALVLSKHRDALDTGASFELAPYPSMIRFHDKLLLHEFATEVGVRTPRTELLREQEVRASSKWPVVLKVRQSSSARGVALVGRAEELGRAWRRLCTGHSLVPLSPLLAQAHIDGEQLCTLSYAHRGRHRGTVVYRNVCEFPSSGGAGIVRESIRHREIERMVERLIVASGWHGVVGFDFLVDRATGLPYLVDANPRFTPGVSLALRGGFDIPTLAIGREGRIPATFPVGLRTRIDPLVALWMLEAFVARPPHRRHRQMAARMLLPNPRSTSDFFSLDDLASLRALPAALVDYVIASADPERRGMDYIRDSQVYDRGIG